jgi:probable phosphoglycerate mutase
MPIEVDLVRHGQSVFNALGIYQGASQDSPLSETGRHQAEIAALKLVDRNYRAVYSSPAKRALETAKIIAATQKNNPPLHIEPQFQELDHGIIGGMRESEIAERYPNEWERWLKNPALGVPHFPGGQITTKEADIAFKHLCFLVSLYEDDNKILVVSHGGKIHLIVCKILNCLASYHKFAIPNCARITLIFTEKLRNPESRLQKLYDIKIILGEKPDEGRI